MTPVLTVDSKTLEECCLSNVDEIDFRSSPLPLLPYLKNLVGTNLLEVSQDNEVYFYLMDSHTLLLPYTEDPVLGSV